MNFTLMSYNILSEDHMLKNTNLYSFCPSNVLKWPDRGRRILNEIEINNPDILCKLNFKIKTKIKIKSFRSTRSIH